MQEDSVLEGVRWAEQPELTDAKKPMDETLQSTPDSPADPRSVERWVSSQATVFRDANKKWKPRNKQAALIARRANETLLHTPPPKTQPTYAPTQEQKVTEYRNTIKARITAAEEWRKNRPTRSQRREIQLADRIAAGKRRLEELKAANSQSSATAASETLNAVKTKQQQ